MITVVVGKSRNTTPLSSAVGEKITRTANANCTNRDRKPHEPQLKIGRTATANRKNSDRKEPRPNRGVNLFLGSTVFKSHLNNCCDFPGIQSIKIGLLTGNNEIATDTFNLNNFK